MFAKFKQLIKAKAELYKLFMLVLIGQGSFYLVTTLANSKDTILSMKDLLTRDDLKDNDTFQVVTSSH